MKIEIINDFLNKKDFEDLHSLSLDVIGRNELKVYHNSISGDNIKTECLSSELLRRLQKNYHHTALELLKKLSPQKVSLYDYSEFHIIETGADYEFPIHDDTPNKLLSGVVYIKPSINSGTTFYDSKNGDGKKEIEWKKNRAIFFSRVERETWHSYKGDKKSNRIVLVYNLMTKRIREVFKIEKKNYLYGNFRYKFNPYIYRFFKKTI